MSGILVPPQKFKEGETNTILSLGSVPVRVWIKQTCPTRRGWGFPSANFTLPWQLGKTVSAAHAVGTNGEMQTI